MKLLGELRRRNVIRMAGLYLVVAWLLVQVAGTVLPMFEVPTWVSRTLVILLALGFLPMLVFSWVFELTPDGLRRELEAPASDATPPDATRPERRANPRAPETARRLDRLIMIAALTLAAVLLIERFLPDPAGAPALAVREGPAAAPGDATTGPAPSIAVLPFVNMSPDAENGYFADGISEELLGVLAEIDGLTVASRTSSFTFRGKDVPVPEIARALGVQHVLEGSVRRQGQRVRITAQLIRAGTDSRVWSRTWDRDLDDIFLVQQEVAQAIADELMGVLAVPRIEVPAATGDLQAYERFLRGRSRFFQRIELREAIADLEFATERDPDLGEAWLFLASTWSILPTYAADVPRPQARAETERAMVKARRLVPEHPMRVAVEGSLQLEAADLVGGLANLQRAATLRSTDSTPTMWYGTALLQTGYVDEAVTVLERAQRIDPLVGINNGLLGIARLSAGDLDGGTRALDTAREQGWAGGDLILAIALAGRGDRAAAAARLDPAPGATPSPDQAAFRAALLDLKQADAYMTQATDPYFLGQMAIGRSDALLGRWQATARDDDAWRRVLSSLVGVWLPDNDTLRRDPRFFEVAGRAGLVALWEQRGYPPGCSRQTEPAGDRLACAKPAP